MIRKEAVEIISKGIQESPIVSANGFISRDLFEANDKNSNFYMIGSMGPLAIWAAITIRKHNHLIFLLAFSVLMAGIGRLISMRIVGIPGDIFLIYLIPELAIPFIMIISQISLNKKLKDTGGDERK